MEQKFLTCKNPQGMHTMAYMQWGDFNSKLPVVICVHGLTRNNRDFDKLALHLSETHRVLCPDIAGRGLSDNLPDPILYDYDQYILDIYALLNHLGITQVDWIGTSMGGILGMKIAAEPENPIRYLVLNDIGAILAKEALDRIGAYVGKQPGFSSLQDAEAYFRTIYSTFGPLDDDDWDAMARHGVRKVSEGKFILAYDPYIAEIFKGKNEDVDLWPIYDKITCPTLLIRGELSDLLSAEVAKEMTRHGPHAQLHEVKGIGHAPTLIGTEQTEVIKDFLKGINNDIEPENSNTKSNASSRVSTASVFG